MISIGIALTSKGEMAGDPDVMIAGIPARARDGRAMDEIVDKAVFETIDTLPRARRRDPDDVAVASNVGSQYDPRGLGQAAAGSCAGDAGLNWRPR